MPSCGAADEALVRLPALAVCRLEPRVGVLLAAPAWRRAAPRRRAVRLRAPGTWNAPGRRCCASAASISRSCAGSTGAARRWPAAGLRDRRSAGPGPRQALPLVKVSADGLRMLDDERFGGRRRRQARERSSTSASAGCSSVLSRRARSVTSRSTISTEPGRPSSGGMARACGLDGAAGAGERRQRQLDRALLAVGHAPDEVGAGFDVARVRRAPGTALRSTCRGSTAPTSSSATGFIARMAPSAETRTTQAGSRSTSVRRRLSRARRLSSSRACLWRAQMVVSRSGRRCGPARRLHQAFVHAALEGPQRGRFVLRIDQQHHGHVEIRAASRRPARPAVSASRAP